MSTTDEKKSVSDMALVDNFSDVEVTGFEIDKLGMTVDQMANTVSALESLQAHALTIEDMVRQSKDPRNHYGDQSIFRGLTDMIGRALGFSFESHLPCLIPPTDEVSLEGYSAKISIDIKKILKMILDFIVKLVQTGKKYFMQLYGFAKADENKNLIIKKRADNISTLGAIAGYFNAKTAALIAELEMDQQAQVDALERELKANGAKPEPEEFTTIPRTFTTTNCLFNLADTTGKGWSDFDFDVLTTFSQEETNIALDVLEDYAKYMESVADIFGNAVKQFPAHFDQSLELYKAELIKLNHKFFSSSQSPVLKAFADSDITETTSDTPNTGTLSAYQLMEDANRTDDVSSVILLGINDDQLKDSSSNTEVTFISGLKISQAFSKQVKPTQQYNKGVDQRIEKVRSLLDKVNAEMMAYAKDLTRQVEGSDPDIALQLAYQWLMGQVRYPTFYAEQYLTDTTKRIYKIRGLKTRAAMEIMNEAQENLKEVIASLELKAENPTKG